MSSGTMGSGGQRGRVLVTGATGTTGSRLTELLVARGTAVTSASRSGTGSHGTSGVRFDWYDASTYQGALADVEAVYLIPPVRDPAPQAVMLPFLERARAAGVRRAVLHSNSVTPAGGPGIGAVHKAIVDMFGEWAVLRPSWFMQNVTGSHVHAQSIRVTSAIVTAAGNGRAGFVDAGDIARAAAVALLRPLPVNTDLILTGPQALSYDEVAAILSEVSGRAITHRNLDPAELVAYYKDIGVPTPAAQFLPLMDAVVASGTEDRTTDAVERITGQPPRSYREFALAEFRI
ncbi:MAG TPA: NAD-dependent epimerase/dehydratase family protein [Trebonia sp.]